jgi:uncharacterized glyoxalase superfamily protein PhnB
MNLKLSTCFVLVNDPEAALSFYRDTLGLEVRNDVARDTHRWITVGSSAQPEVSIVLTNFVNGSPEDNDAVASMIAKGALYGVHLQAEDLEGTFQRLREGGAEIVQEPADQPWGVRDGAVRDPSGNLIRIEQPA